MIYVEDVVYFNTRCAPGNKDWLRCKVIARDVSGIKVAEQYRYGDPPVETFYPAHQIQRVEYNR